LQNEYKGDVKVRAIIQSLRRQLEKIKMEKNEVVDEFTNRIIKVMNQMKSYGEEISDKKEVIEKMLISLLKKFDLIMAIK
jgi:DNA polymerase sigma